MADPGPAEAGQDGRLADFVPLAERAVQIDPATLLRLRGEGELVAGFVRLPYEVLAGRTIRVSPRTRLRRHSHRSRPARLACRLGPGSGRQGCALAEPAAAPNRLATTGRGAGAGDHRPGPLRRRAGSHGHQPGGQQALLASVVLRVQAAGAAVEVPLGPFSALTRLDFLPPASQVAVDTAPGWLRLATPLGSAFLATGQSVLGLLG